MHQLSSADRERLLAFQRQAGALQRAALGARAAAADAADRIAHVKRAAEVWPGLEPSVRDEARSLQLRLLDLQQRLEGDPTRPSREEPGMPGIVDRVQNVVYGVWAGASLPTATQRRNVEIASSELAGIVEPLRQIVEVELPALEDRLDAAGAPWTPGRGVPAWPPQ
jgi:hypothetical protein